jgi:hypothetical protein
MPKVFISYDYSDSHEKKTIDNWKNQGLGRDISFSSEEDLSHIARGEAHLKEILRGKIEQAQKVLVLVGDNTHKRKWVDYEVAHAKSKGKPVLWVRITGTDGAPPEEIRKTGSLPLKLEEVMNALRKND